jgi:hypothetical protein
MATLIQLSATSWLNMDTVTLIRQEGEQWRVWLSGHERSLTLTPEEVNALEYHVTRHSDKTAYNQTRPRSHADGERV